MSLLLLGRGRIQHDPPLVCHDQGMHAACMLTHRLGAHQHPGRKKLDPAGLLVNAKHCVGQLQVVHPSPQGSGVARADVAMQREVPCDSLVCI
jgi:hypothetical protein